MSLKVYDQQWETFLKPETFLIASLWVYGTLVKV